MKNIEKFVELEKINLFHFLQITLNPFKFPRNISQNSERHPALLQPCFNKY